jgi:hypothetical protein
MEEILFALEETQEVVDQKLDKTESPEECGSEDDDDDDDDDDEEEEEEDGDDDESEDWMPYRDNVQLPFCKAGSENLGATELN